METLDEQNSKIPNDAIVAMVGMTKWMTFSGIMLIIVNVLFLLMLINNPAPQSKVFMIFSLISVGMAFFLISKSSAFRTYSYTRNEGDLIKALKSTQLYFMMSTIFLILSIITTFSM